MIKQQQIQKKTIVEKKIIKEIYTVVQETK